MRARRVDPRQLGLFDAECPAPPPSARTPDELRAALDRLLRGRLGSLVLIDARTRMLAVRRLPGDELRYALRLHRCFAAAPDEALAAVAAWVKAGRRSPRAREALAILRGHFERLRGAPPPPHRAGGSPRGHAPLRPQGRTLDLRAVCAEINARYFAGTLEVEITWGRGGGTCDARGPHEPRSGNRRRRRRARRPTLQLGSFDHDRRLIRIHPVLDAPSVPRYVVESIVHHELLHALLPPSPGAGRRRLVHSPELRRRERLFPDHARAERWIARHLPDLLRRR